MKKLCLALALASLSVITASRATTIIENFTNNPACDGWRIFGDTNLFCWDSTNHVLDVTWDSSQSNSFFYIPLGNVLTKSDDFSFSFDLTLTRASTGDSTGPLSLALGFLNLTNAIDPGFERGAGVSPNIAEFDYYPAGYFPPSYPSPATATPSFVDSTSSAFAPDDLTPYQIELPTNVLMHIALAYTASNQTASLSIVTNGTALAQFPGLVINPTGNGGFAATNDYRVDMFSVTSFSEAGTYPPYVASIYAQGTVSNLVVTVPPPPVLGLSGTFSNGLWQAQFISRSNWLYTLECTTNFVSWTDVSATTSGNGTNQFLEDVNAPASRGFYRIRAERP
jgi:hypothetical protein